jgi:hypothetical protein
MHTPAIIGGLCAAAIIAASATAEPFTYQGTLEDNGSPADGTYDLRFELYATPVAGAQVASPVIINDVTVIDGRFTVELDFGSGVFQDTDRYLEIEVRDGASAGSYTTLSPRTAINPAPSAQHASTADTLTNPIWNQSGSIISGGTGLDRLLLNRTNLITPSEYFGIHANVNSFVGMYVSGPAGAFPFYGYANDGEISAYTYFDPNDTAWKLVNSNLFEVLSARSDNNIHVNNDLVVNKDVVAESFEFEQPKLHYHSIPGDIFTSITGDSYQISPQGAAYITTFGAPGELVAPLSLPHGATITKFRVIVDDLVTGDITVVIGRRDITSGLSVLPIVRIVTTIGGVSSAQQLLIDDEPPTGFDVINNNQYTYHIRATSNNWNGTQDLSIRNVVIEYTTTEAD